MKNIKSKASRQKIRRWSFLVMITLKDGNRGTFNPGAFTIGNSSTAISTSAEIRQSVAQLPQYAEATVIVEPQAHETISNEVLNQIKGLEAEGTILTRALQMAVREAMSLKLGETVAEAPAEFDSTVAVEVGKFVVAARTELLERRKAAQLEKVAAELVDTDGNPVEVPPAELDGVTPESVTPESVTAGALSISEEAAVNPLSLEV